MKHLFCYCIVLMCCFSCKSYMSEEEAFIKSIRKEIPFSVENLKSVSKSEFFFSNSSVISAIADFEIQPDGAIYVVHTYFDNAKSVQTENVIFRNIIVNRKQHRVVCVDRVLSEGRNHGFIYVLQSESRKFPTYGIYHWDVSDWRNVQMVGEILTDLKNKSLKRVADAKK